jgi:hypothetical protein
VNAPDASASPTPTSDYDALADLFLADERAAPTPQTARMRLVSAPPDDPSEPDMTVARARRADPVPIGPNPSAAGPAHVEGAIVGHLPVLASAWLTQYARHEADQAKEPVVLVRFHDTSLSLDVVLPTGAKPPPGLAAKPGENPTAIIQRAAFLWRRWLIRVDQNAEPQLLRNRLSSLALLTGADEAAVVSSYQLIKNLADSGAGEAPPRVRLVIMGAQDAKAGDAEQSLKRAAGKFMGATIEDALRIPKIGAALSIQIYRGPASLGLDDVLDSLEAIRGTGQAQRIVVPKAEPQPLPIPKIEAPQLTIPDIPRSSPAPGPAKFAPPTINGDSSPLPAGLTPINLDCPYAPGIELTRDEEGRLHLLARVVQTIPTIADAAQRLLTAATWANDHAKLLGAASAGLKDAATPTLHILTLDARPARALLDTGMRVHLLVRVESGGWAISDLN